MAIVTTGIENIDQKPWWSSYHCYLSFAKF